MLSRRTIVARVAPTWAVLLTVAPVACGSAGTRPPGKPPTPGSVTRADPGGDAHDPHEAAIRRLLDEPWGRRSDKDDQLEVPLPDWEKWKRVRYWGVKHFTGFRYGDDHHAVAIVFVHDVPRGDRVSSEACLRRFEKWAWPQVKSYEVDLGRLGFFQSRWRGEPLTVKLVDGSVDTGFRRRFFSAAWAAYPAYPHACLVYAVAIPWRGHKELAHEVRRRFMDEGFARIRPLTRARPHRK